MASPKEGFLTDGQREVLKIAAQNAEIVDFFVVSGVPQQGRGWWEGFYWCEACEAEPLRETSAREEGRGTVHDSIGALKQLVNLPTLCITGLRNVVNIEDAKDADIKHKHQLQELFLYWNAVDYRDVEVSRCQKDTLLHLEVFVEENKDVPTDEKREEAMLKYLQPHANLKSMVIIDGYGGSQFPKWLGNLHSLKTLEICNCPRLQLLSKEGLSSELQNLRIEECQQLTTLAVVGSGIPHLHARHCLLKASGIWRYFINSISRHPLFIYFLINF